MREQAKKNWKKCGIREKYKNVNLRAVESGDHCAVILSTRL